MTQPEKTTSRREFLKTSSKIATVSALAGVALPHVHAQGSDQLRVALVGAGGRGSGAAVDAMTAKKGSVKLAAMADVFNDRMNGSYNALKNGPLKEFVEVNNDTKFIGFDAFKQAMDVLKPGDIAIFATPLAFRWVHYQYAIEKKLNVFMEKPLTADGPTSRKLLELAKKSSDLNLKSAVGLMSRHARHLEELKKRIDDGEIGDLILMRGYRMHGPVGSMASLPYKTQKLPGGDENTELEYQIRRFHSFLWASGGCFSDFYIHHIDHLCWMKGAWPVKAQGTGGRHYKNSPEGAPYVDQNFDSYSVEYTFEDGSKFYFDGRCMVGAEPRYYSYVHGSKGVAIASKNGDCGEPASTYRGQGTESSKRIWQSDTKPEDKNPYVNEWRDFLTAIREDKPYNEVPRGVQASVVTNMGRYAAHTGASITYEEALNHEHNMAPDADNFTRESPAPLQADANGRYPQPMPGIVTNREYGPAAA